MANDNKTIQRIIDQKIKEIGSSRDKIQRAAKVGTSYIRDLGDGDTYDAHKLASVARALGLSPNALMGIDTAGPPSANFEASYNEIEIRHAIGLAFASTVDRDPKYIADMVVMFLKGRSLEVSTSPSEPDILKTG